MRYDRRIIDKAEDIDVFIVAITSPTVSTKSIETSCTAGFDRNGNWVRVYPVQLRMLKQSKEIYYGKYEWVRFSTIPASTDDKRPESRKCTSDGVHPLNEKIGTDNNWEGRKKICLGPGHIVYNNFDKLLEDSRPGKWQSLAVFKPTEIIGCSAEDISQSEIDEIMAKQKRVIANNTHDLFEDDYEFIQADPPRIRLKYKFSDVNGKIHTLEVLDWEAYMLYWNCKKKGDSHEIAKQKTVKKYDSMRKNSDLYFFLGTRKEQHMKMWRNPFSIIGVFYPPKVDQLDFDF